MLKGVPRAFLVLLAIYFLLDIAGALLSGSIMSLGAIAGLYAAYRIFSMNPEGAIAQLVIVAFLASIAGYVFLSPKLKSFYAASSTSYWSGSP